MNELWNFMGAWGGQLPRAVLLTSLWCGAVLALVRGVDLLGRRVLSPRWRMALYAAVFVRLILPLDFAAPLGVVADGSSAVSPAVSTNPFVGRQELLAVHSATRGTVEDGATASQPAFTSTTVRFVTGHALAATYLLGVMALLGVALFRRRALRHLVASMPNARAEASRMAEALGGTSPAIAVLEHPHLGPFAWSGGLGSRSAVVLPSPLVDRLDPETLRCVLAHELAHCARRDPTLAAALATVAALAWPILPVWLAVARVRQLMEMAADERAVSQTSVPAYGRALVQLADLPHRFVAAPGISPANFRRLAARVRAVGTAPPSVPAWVQLSTVTLTVFAVIACAGLDDETTARSTDVACDDLAERAQQLHDTSERTGGNEDAPALAADAAYLEYTHRCGGHDEFAEVTYYHAELQWSLAARADARGETSLARTRFDAARRTFEAALAHDPGQLTQDAAQGSLLSRWNALGTNVDPERRPHDKYPLDGEVAHDDSASSDEDPFARTPYSAEERDLLQTYDLYEANVTDPEDEGRQRVLYHRTKLAMTHNRFDEAEVSARRLLDESDGTVAHVRVAEMLTDILTVRWMDPEATAEDKIAAELAMERWLSRLDDAGFMDHEQADVLKDARSRLGAGIEWTRGMRAQAAGDHRACAERFEALADANPDHRALDRVLLQAVTCRLAADDRAAAENLATRMERELPRSPHTVEARALLRAR